MRYLLGTRRSSAGQRVFTKLLNYSSPVVATGSPLPSFPAKKFAVTFVTHWAFLAGRFSTVVVALTAASNNYVVVSFVVCCVCARLLWRIDWAVTAYAEVCDRLRGSFIVNAALSYY